MTRAIEKNYYDIKENELELSKNELMFFKEALEEKKEKIQRNLENVTNESITQTQNRCRDEADHASLESTSHVNEAVFREQSITLNKINRSLNKIAIGTYGTCTLCEEPINIERLKIQMFTEYCVPCREIMEQQQ